jgi:photosystem II stability/assembly factor-like uncharacterized protein
VAVAVPLVTTDVACSYFWKITFPTPEVGYASLEQRGGEEDIIFYKTTDGGLTWERHTISKSLIGGDAFYFQAIGFVNEAEGWIGGASNTSSSAHNFLHTTDGGQTWRRVLFVDENTGGIDVVMHPNDPRTLFAATWQLVIRTSGDIEVIKTEWIVL